MNVLNYIKTNPKKSIFGSAVVSFIGKWLYGLNEDQQYRYTICRNIKEGGTVNVNWNFNPKTITVFLNPSANNGKASKLFDKNAAPIFHLSGCNVKVIKLEYEGQAKQFLSVLENTDVIVAAGGNGTVNEVVTGLLRRPDFESWSKVPIGIIPLGTTNTVYRQLCSEDDCGRVAQKIMNATNAIVQSNAKPVDVMKITGENGKSVFALSDLRWGSYSDAFGRTSNYWYWGPLKKYMTYMLASVRSQTRTPRTLELMYSKPIPSQKPDEVLERPTTNVTSISVNPIFAPFKNIVMWLFSPFVKSNALDTASKVESSKSTGLPDPSTLSFDDMANFDTIEFTASVNSIHTDDVQGNNLDATAQISVEKAGSDFSKLDFISSGLKRFSEARPLPVKPEAELVAHQFRIIPKVNSESWFKIDNEDFEAMTCTAQVLPKVVNLICTDSMA